MVARLLERGIPFQIPSLVFLRQSLETRSHHSHVLIYVQNKSNILTNFSPMLHFYTPWKRQKTFGFLAFSGIEMEYRTKVG